MVERDWKRERSSEQTGEGSSEKRYTRHRSPRTLRPYLEPPLVCNNISSYCFDTSPSHSLSAYSWPPLCLRCRIRFYYSLFTTLRRSRGFPGTATDTDSINLPTLPASTRTVHLRPTLCTREEFITSRCTYCFFFLGFFCLFFRYCYKLRLILFRTFIVSHFFPRPGLYH